MAGLEAHDGGDALELEGGGLRIDTVVIDEELVLVVRELAPLLFFGGRVLEVVLGDYLHAQGGLELVELGVVQREVDGGALGSGRLVDDWDEERHYSGADDVL